MFLAASPYFQSRFSSDSRLLSAYSPTLLTVSTVTNLLVMLILTYLQTTANYPSRIILSLIINSLAFSLLALSTVLFRDVSPALYFGFLMSMVFSSSLATGLCQNGVFAFVAAFNMPKYTQAIMMGQAVAGVLPSIAQIVSVLAVPPPSTSDRTERDKDPGGGMVAPHESGKSAFAYFLTAIPISVATLLAFMIILRRHPDTGTSISQSLPKSTPVDPPLPYDGSTPTTSLNDQNDDSSAPTRKSVSLLTLYKKLHWLATAVFLTFTLTMFFPVFTQRIHSASTSTPLPRLLEPSCFIPLAFLFWNVGDLLGRTLTLHPHLAALTHYPKTIFVASIARVIWLPLYELCSKGTVKSDFFYLVIVQGGFGVSSGLIGSLCMMGAGEWVEPDEREVAGGFMGLMLVGGLSVGSLASFLVM